MLKIEDIQRVKLFEVGWRFGQAYSGGHVASQMIMHCLANRYRSGWGSWLEIIDKVPAFMAENELPPLEFPTAWNGSFIKVCHVVDGIFDGSVQDISKGALYWADLTKIEREWFRTRIIDPVKEEGPQAGLRQHPIVANINSLSFFR